MMIGLLSDIQRSCSHEASNEKNRMYARLLLNTMCNFLSNTCRPLAKLVQKKQPFSSSSLLIVLVQIQ